MGRLAAIAVAAISLTGLAGCGFTPLYASGGVTAGLSHIDVAAPDGRTAYLIREKLDDELGRDKTMPPAYRLDYTVGERRDPRGLGADNAASRYELTVDVDWKLTDTAGGAEKTHGRTQVLITYDAVDAPYAGIAAQSDSQERAAAEAARRIRLELAQYFANANRAVR